MCTCVTTRFEFHAPGGAKVDGDRIVLFLTWFRVGGGFCKVTDVLRDILFCRDHSFEFRSVCLAEGTRNGADDSAAASMLRAVELCVCLTESETEVGLACPKGALETRKIGDGTFTGSRIFDLATVDVLTNADCGMTVTPGGNRPLTSVI